MSKMTADERRAMVAARRYRFGSESGASAVEAALEAGERQRDPELQFSILCRLSGIDPRTLPRRLSERYVHAIVRFLRSGRHERASEYWMAGDLLGDHWRNRSTTRVLFGLLETARGDAAIRGILHGIAMHHGRSRSPGARARLLATWRNFNATHRRKAVVRSSRWALESALLRQERIPRDA